ncbi:MAG: anaerobic ribonucleoside-triphosphate reductase activating protein [Methanothrix soehngenii]|nr:anaerobic ribonucleoside-triphosphate reductase activating protein [Methanothrix soehngenii]
MLCNFGGFVPMSTVDWHGRSVCVVFLRGCPARCFYCHNIGITTGIDIYPVETVIDLIQNARPFISGVIFSGGEATAQPDVLTALCKACKDQQLATGVHTNGMFPATVCRLIDRQLIDKVALDVKTTWDRYPSVAEIDAAPVKTTLDFCVDAYHRGWVPEFEVVTTVFRGHETDVATIVTYFPDDIPYVLQQGVYRGIRPLSASEIEQVADTLGRPVLVRTRQTGEYRYDPKPEFDAIVTDPDGVRDADRLRKKSTTTG